MPVGHAELICYPLEAALIGRRGEIVADRDRGKAACDAFCAQLVDFQCYIGCECFRDLATVDDFRGHPVLRSGVSLARAAQCCAMTAASAAAACAWLIRGSPGPPRTFSATKMAALPATATPRSQRPSASAGCPSVSVPR